MAATNGALGIRADSELMKNQKQAVVMDAQKEFQALQTTEGYAIFFSIGSNGVFYVVREVQESGVQESGYGWNRTDLSSSLLRKGDVNGKAKLFAVSQNPQTLAIDIALVMSMNGSDSLYLSRNNATCMDEWERGVSWTSVPFDASSQAPSPLVISNVYMLTREATGNEPGSLTWFVDIVSNPGRAFRFLERYYIEPDSSVKWCKHTLPNNVEEGTISSCLGRRLNDNVDGIYTMGMIGQSTSLLFTPKKNPWSNKSPPSSARLDVPEGASAISSCANEDGLTNLFVAADGGLYLFPPDQQKDRAKPSLILPSSPVCDTNTFAGATCLRSSTVGSQTAVWGLNGQADLIYTTCTPGKEAEPTSWSPPMAIGSGVSQFAFYLNRVAPANVLFARVGIQSLVQFTQDPKDGIWRSHSITLPTIDTDKIFETTTYTTQIKCTDQNGMPAAGTGLHLQSKQSVPLMINDTYRKIRPDSPAEIKTDDAGNITIVQETDALPAICFTLSYGKQTLIVDPQSKVAERLAAVKSGSDLTNVRIPDSDGKTKPLVPADVPDTDRNTVATVLPKLLEVKSSLRTSGSLDTTKVITATDTTGQAGLWGVVSHSGKLHFCEREEALASLNESLSTLGYPTMSSDSLSTSAVADWIPVSPGDLFQYLKNAWENVKKFFVDTAQGINRFVAEIGGKIYTAILDTVNAVISAVEFVFNKIKVFFEDLVAWLGFLFDWGDILRTHKVVKTILKEHAKYAVDQISVIEDQIRLGFKNVRGNVRDWAKIQDSGRSMGDEKQERASQMNNPQCYWALYHTKNGLSLASSPYAIAQNDRDRISQLLDVLANSLKKEEKDVINAIRQVQEQVCGRIQDLTAVQAIQKLLEILSNLILDSAENIIIGLLDTIKNLLSGIMDLLDAPLEIPILSALYYRLTGSKLSFLDLVCLIGAIPATVTFKALAGRAPFGESDTAEVSSLPLTQRSKGDSKIQMASGQPTQSRAEIIKTVLKFVSWIGSEAKVIFLGVSRATKSPKAVIYITGVVSAMCEGPNLLLRLATSDPYAGTMVVIRILKVLIDAKVGEYAIYGNYISPITNTAIGIASLPLPIIAIRDLDSGNRKSSDWTNLGSGVLSSVSGMLGVLTSSAIMGSEAVAGSAFVISLVCMSLSGELSGASGALMINGE